jgi:hypothetical protein
MVHTDNIVLWKVMPCSLVKLSTIYQIPYPLYDGRLQIKIVEYRARLTASLQINIAEHMDRLTDSLQINIA